MSRSATLPEWKIVALDQLGLVWDPRLARWERELAAARRFREEHGHLSVTDHYIDATGYRLGDFIAHQRAKRRGSKQGGLIEEEIAALDELGMVWEVKRQYTG
ncbi:helicase associated domain-containing protein [Nonomuraea sp. NPDC003727]